MGSAQRSVTVDGHRLKLTHLDKVLFPASGTTKAEVIEYFQNVADAMMPHLAGRPVTRKRWPDGVGTAEEPKEAFFRKNLEDSAPEWVPRLALQHADHVNVYPVLDSPAGLAWFGQVAALELHVPQWRFRGEPTPGAGETAPAPSERRHPDRLVLDLDPGQGVGLKECAQVARWCREILDSMNLPSVPVSSGSKGLHLYAALDGSYTSEQVSDVAKELARSLAEDHPDDVVSTMKKTQRAGKVLIDWSQNHWNKTTVAPYSLRGRAGSAEGPFVAAPRTWDELEDPELEQLDFRQVMGRVADGKDPLEQLRPPEALSAASDDRLSTYRSKREAAKTPEPAGDSESASRSAPAKADSHPAPSASAANPARSTSTQNERDGTAPLFVIQEHHASSLHFDTRLEHDGVLVSWAVPKAPPLHQGTQHLAIQTEDHPLDYARFEGTIPKGQYGGGEVSIWDSGTVDIEKWQAGKVVFVLHGRPDGGLGGEPRRFVLVRTEDEGKEWLIRLMKRQPKGSSSEKASASAKSRSSAADCAEGPPQHSSPMLAVLGRPSDIRGKGWAFEGKWDGYRVLSTVNDDGVVLRSRHDKDLTDTFPELAELADLAPQGTVLDGEVVALNSSNRPEFSRLQKRGQLTKRRDIERATQQNPVHYLVFDILHTAEHGDLRSEPYSTRRGLLSRIIREGQHVKVPGDMGDSLRNALEVSEELALEGIVCKRQDSSYSSGQRSDNWVKIKHESHADVTIIGWRQGNGSRESTFGSLLLAMPDAEGHLAYAGRVGTGFNDRELKDLRAQLDELTRKTPPVDDVPEADMTDASWVRPTLQAEVRHAGFTQENRLRHPSWRSLAS